MTSTAAEGKNGKQVRVGKPAADLDRITEIKNVVKTYLSNFKYLDANPDSLYWIMATFGAESSWQLYHPTTSRHPQGSIPLTEVIGSGPVPGGATLTGTDYQYSNIVQNKWKEAGVTTQTKENIKEGWYAHGISACMGCYHVKGTPANTYWRRSPEAQTLINGLGLEVDVGTAITTTLFGADDATCRLRSIVSGMIVFNDKYKAGITKFAGDTAAAMRYALGAYVGNETARDIYGTSAASRRDMLTGNSSANAVRAGLLEKVGVLRSGDSGTLSQAEVDLLVKGNASFKATKVVNNTRTNGPATNNNVQGKSEKKAGCEI